MRLILALIAVSALYVTAPSVARADATEEANAKALAETQAMLQDPKAVADYAKMHPDAAKATSNITTLTGGNEADQADIYKLASEIFGNVVKDSNGNAMDMQAALAAAMKNPQAFAAKLTPEQQAQLKSLASKIESRGPSSGPH